MFSDTIILLHDTLTLLMFIGFSCCFLCLTLLDAYQVKFKYATEISNWVLYMVEAENIKFDRNTDEIKQHRSRADVTKCQLLFVAESEK